MRKLHELNTDKSEIYATFSLEEFNMHAKILVIGELGRRLHVNLRVRMLLLLHSYHHLKL